MSMLTSVEVKAENEETKARNVGVTVQGQDSGGADGGR